MKRNEFFHEVNFNIAPGVTGATTILLKFDSLLKSLKLKLQ